jgi:hypothetical protein
MTAVVGFFFLKETHHVRIWDEVSGAAPATAEKPAEVIDVTEETTAQGTGRAR